ncbi:hypothetical protein [Novipirellula sp.]|uniref:hypothetical protein n=1 Tax=Novipirellula sp. TaxID=2795430 RepID=UPI00356AF744
MTTNNITTINLVQAMCLRPRMYTKNGTVAEVCELLMDVNSPQPIGGSRNNASALATVAWLRANTSGDRHVAAELLAECGTDENALAKICEFASTLPPD